MFDYLILGEKKWVLRYELFLIAFGETIDGDLIWLNSFPFHF
jgi:hypothetical protein